MKIILKLLLKIRLRKILRDIDRYEKADIINGYLKKELLLITNMIGFYEGDV